MTVLYGAIQFFFWFAYGTAVNFSSVYLLDCGLSNTAIGVINAVACAVSVVLQPLVAAYADREKSLSIRVILLYMIGGLLGFAGLLILCYGRGAALNGGLLGCAVLLVQVALPLVNALATESINAGKNLRFSISRGFGSIGYAVMSFTVGRLTARYGAGAAPWVLLIAALCWLVSVAVFPFAKPRKAGKSAAEQKGEGPLAFFRRYPVLTVTLAGCVLIYTGHMLINSFVFQIVSDKGGTSEHMGIVMGLAGLLEVLTMFFFTALLRWRDHAFWFRISGIFFALKSLGTLLAGSMGALYTVQLLHPLGWGLMTVASVYYVNARVSDQDKIKGQAYMTMTLSAGTIIGTLIGGWLIDHTGVSGMLLVAVIVGAVGEGIVLFGTRKR